MITWEPIKGRIDGHAIVHEGTGRERKIVLQSEDDFEFLKRLLARKSRQDRQIAYGDAINTLRKLAEERHGEEA